MSNTNGFVNLPTGIYLNVRKEPNFYSQVLTSLAPKTQLTILEQNGAWYQIKYNNTSAYVYAEAVSTLSSIVLGGVDLNLNIPNNFEFGTSGQQPTFNWNALVKTSLIPIKNKEGLVQNGYFTSNGDHITIIKNNPQTGLTFIQYPDQSKNLYQQGWIDSSYISETYLDFRFDACWTNLIDNQKIYLFNNSISSTTLTKNTNYTLLYTVTNYNIEYSCILFEENNSLKTGFIVSTTGKLNFLVDNYPFTIQNENTINTYLPTVSLNAVVNKSIDLIDINGIKPNYYINSKKDVVYPSLEVGTKIAIIQVFNSVEEDSMLIEYFDKGSNTYLKAYLPTESLFNNVVSINPNIINWAPGVKSVNLVDLSNSKTIYTLPISQKVQLLYCTTKFACILFNNNNLPGEPLQTGYVNLIKLIQTGWKEIAGKWYYFDSNGIMLKGWQTIDSKEYYFDNNGVMQTGWYKEWGDSYYFDLSGAMVKGSQTIGGQNYYFNSNGTMDTNAWQEIAG
ncbi:MAG: SH3 domain-containing protein, partial [Sarcina sp.]